MLNIKTKRKKENIDAIGIVWHVSSSSSSPHVKAIKVPCYKNIKRQLYNLFLVGKHTQAE